MKKKKYVMIELVPQSESDFRNISETLSVPSKVLFYGMQSII